MCLFGTQIVDSMITNVPKMTSKQAALRCMMILSEAQQQTSVHVIGLNTLLEKYIIYYVPDLACLVYEVLHILCVFYGRASGIS